MPAVADILSNNVFEAAKTLFEDTKSLIISAYGFTRAKSYKLIKLVRQKDSMTRCRHALRIICIDPIQRSASKIDKTLADRRAGKDL